MGPGRVIEAHCEIKRDARPTQMTAPSGDSRRLQLTRTSAEHVDPDQPTDKRPYVVPQRGKGGLVTATSEVEAPG